MEAAFEKRATNQESDSRRHSVAKEEKGMNRILDKQKSDFIQQDTKFIYPEITGFYSIAKFILVISGLLIPNAVQNTDAAQPHRNKVTHSRQRQLGE